MVRQTWTRVVRRDAAVAGAAEEAQEASADGHRGRVTRVVALRRDESVLRICPSPGEGGQRDEADGQERRGIHGGSNKEAKLERGEGDRKECREGVEAKDRSDWH